MSVESEVVDQKRRNLAVEARHVQNTLDVVTTFPEWFREHVFVSVQPKNFGSESMEYVVRVECDADLSPLFLRVLKAEATDAGGAAVSRSFATDDVLEMENNTRFKLFLVFVKVLANTEVADRVLFTEEFVAHNCRQLFGEPSARADTKDVFFEQDVARSFCRVEMVRKTLDRTTTTFNTLSVMGETLVALVRARKHVKSRVHNAVREVN